MPPSKPAGSKVTTRIEIVVELYPISGYVAFVYIYGTLQFQTKPTETEREALRLAYRRLETFLN